VDNLKNKNKQDLFWNSPRINSSLRYLGKEIDLNRNRKKSIPSYVKKIIDKIK
jgi:uncharacterized protein (DUF2132 family)